MPTCGISKGIGIVCDKILVPGTKDRLILIRYEEIVSTTPDAANKKIISSITRKSTSKAYAFDGQNNSNIARAKFSRSKYYPAYAHEVDFVAFDLSPDALLTLESLNLDRVVAVYEDNNKFFRICGLNAGLRTSANDSDTENADTGGGHVIQLSSAQEKGYPEYLAVYTGTAPNQVYDYAASKALFEGLLLAAV